MKFCKDCKWSHNGVFILWLFRDKESIKCKHPKNTENKKKEYDLVTGKEEKSDKFKYCSMIREGWYSDKCGKEGKLHEPR